MADQGNRGDDTGACLVVVGLIALGLYGVYLTVLAFVRFLLANLPVVFISLALVAVAFLIQYTYITPVQITLTLPSRARRGAREENEQDTLLRPAPLLEDDTLLRPVHCGGRRRRTPEA